MAQNKARTANYTREECLSLINLVTTFKNIIENKRTDAATWNEKKEAWNKIATKFNACTTRPRSAEQLRSKYESLKKETRKETTKARNLQLQTGGGPYNDFTWDPILAKIRELIELSCVGMNSQFDSDHCKCKACFTMSLRISMSPCVIICYTYRNRRSLNLSGAYNGAQW